MTFHTKTVTEIFEEFNSSEYGLSRSGAAERILQYGENVLKVRGEPLWRKIVEPFKSIFMLVLFVAAFVSIISGDVTEALIVIVIIFANTVIYYIQRFSTERILRSLQKHDKLLVSVLRDKNIITLDSSQLVPGDVIILDEGEKIPADARLIETNSFRVDESQLTGESLPIEKQIDELPDDREIFERSNMVYRGSFVVGGSAKAMIVATANDTEFGKLATLSVIQSDKSPVQQKINSLIDIIIRIIAVIAIVVFLLGLYRGMGLAEGLRYVLALSVSAVPESLPVAISIVLVLGMRRMAEKKALVKTMNAIQTVGCLTVIATDKTGTLTKNRLTVQKVWSPDGDASSAIRSIGFSINKSSAKVFDPLDIAFQDYFLSSKNSKEVGQLMLKLPFNQDYAMSGNIYKNAGSFTIWIKGSPESILSRSMISEQVHQTALAELHSMAANGFRVIALAHKHGVSDDLSLDAIKENDLTFDGFVAVADILRTEAKSAIRVAQQAGIDVYMVTGDHFETAFHIGEKLGLVEQQNQVFDCRKLNEISDNELEVLLRDVRVFARVVPENKYRILMALKNKHIVAMTGDGVNDVPALANAHVGIAMGSGASIAKDAGNIVLLDNNFQSIIHAVHEGRSIYANIKRMVAYLLSTSTGEVLIAIISLIAGIPVPLIAVQILWVNLVTDTCLVIPLGLEPGEVRNMKRPPQSLKAPLFSRFMISRIILIAVTMATLTTIVYLGEINRSGVDYARTVAFHVIVVMQWSSALCYRSDYETLFIRLWRFSPTFLIGLSIAVILQTIAMSGAMGGLLHLASISLSDAIKFTLIAFLVPIVVVEIHKWVGRQFFNKGHNRKT